MKIKSLLTWICFLHSIAAISQKATVSGEIQNISPGKMAWTLMPMDIFGQPQTLTVPLHKNSFHQQLDITEITYVSIGDGTGYVGGFVEPGDSIFMRYDALARDETITFSGPGHDKFQIASAIDEIRIKTKGEIDLAKKQKFPLDYYLPKVDSIENAALQSIIQKRKLLSDEAYRQLYAYLKAATLRTKYNGIISTFGDSFDGILRDNQHRISEKSKQNMMALFQFDDKLSGSPFYTNMAQNILSLYLDENVPSHGTEMKFRNLVSRVSGNLGTKIMYLAAKREIREDEHVSLDTIIATSFRSPGDSVFIRHLRQQYAAAHEFKPGMQAPDFSVETSEGKKISLSSLAGKTVYLDFWFAGCAPCHQLFKDISQVKKHFRNDPDVVFLVVSVDEKETWRRALNRFHIDGLHAFTENKLRNHPMIEAYHVAAYPSTYIIDAGGKFFSVNPSRSPEELKSQILNARAQGPQK